MEFNAEVFYERQIKTIFTLTYANTISFTERPKLIGVGIISAFHPLSTIDLKGETGLQAEAGLALTPLFSIGFMNAEKKRGKQFLKMPGGCADARIAKRQR